MPSPRRCRPVSRENELPAAPLSVVLLRRIAIHSGMVSVRFAACTALVLLAATAAHAASSDRVEIEGGALRLVVSDAPDAQGRMRAALEIDLEPGWKTYWLEPGGSGVPPAIELSADGQALASSIAFPAPQRFDDAGDVWAGYDRPVAFALTLDTPPATRTLDASVFLGICRDICIPVQARFHVAVAAAASSGNDEQRVAEAFAALPAQPRPGLRLTGAQLDGDDLILAAEAPTGAELFLAADAGPLLGTPTRDGDGARPRFRAPLLDGASTVPGRVIYTLVDGEDAVSGVLVVAR